MSSAWSGEIFGAGSLRGSRPGTADRAWAAYAGNLAGENVDGFTDFRYGEVRRLEGDLGVALSLAMPAGDFDGDIAPYSALLDGVTKIGGTPVTAST